LKAALQAFETATSNPTTTETMKTKIYIATDLEGVSGVSRFEQTRNRTSPDYRAAVDWLMGDISAAVRGFRDAGAGEIVVLDGHGGGNNFNPALMEPGARYVTGIRSASSALWPLDQSFGGLVLLGYHAMCGTADGVLHHTQSSTTERRFWYNGVESGEIVQHAAIAGHQGVPVIMVTGDEATCREARRFLGKGPVTVATKQGISREGAILRPFAETREEIYEGAKEAFGRIARCRPFRLKIPIRAKCQMIVTDPRPSQTRLVTHKAVLRDVQKILVFW
jgi:D-amino peptidase